MPARIRSEPVVASLTVENYVKTIALIAARIEPGRRLALKVIRRHRLLELFLARTLEMSWDEVHEEAEHMEHAASERLVDRIDAYLGYPAVDPHGDPIPRADGSLAETPGIPLARCQPGQHFRVVRVVDQ